MCLHEFDARLMFLLPIFLFGRPALWNECRREDLGGEQLEAPVRRRVGGVPPNPAHLLFVLIRAFLGCSI